MIIDARLHETVLWPGGAMLHVVLQRLYEQISELQGGSSPVLLILVAQCAPHLLMIRSLTLSGYMRAELHRQVPEALGAYRIKVRRAQRR